jgi:hypothetical protein
MTDPLTVAELALRLADFEGNEPVYYGDAGPVRSATRVFDSTGAVVILSAQPPHGEEVAPRGFWRAVVEAITGLGRARVVRRPMELLGPSREER